MKPQPGLSSSTRDSNLGLISEVARTEISEIREPSESGPASTKNKMDQNEPMCIFTRGFLIVSLFVFQTGGLLSDMKLFRYPMRPGPRRDLSMLRMSVREQCEGNRLARGLASAALIACLGSPTFVSAANIESKDPNQVEVSF